MLKHISLTILLIISLAVITGCQKETPTDTSSDAPVKTEAQYKAEADREITEDNMDEALADLEQSIAQDVNETL